MLLDVENEFSSAQAVTASAASTNSIDLGVTNPNSGRNGLDLFLMALCNVTAASVGGNATVQVKLQDSADNSTFVDVLAGKVHAQAAVVNGARLLGIQLPVDLRRYIRVYYTIGTENLTAGAFDSFLTAGPSLV